MPVHESSLNITQQQLTRSRWFGLLIPMALIGLFLFALMALLMNLSYHALEDLAEREIEERMLSSAKKIADQLTNELQQIERLGGLLASQAQVLLSNPEAYKQPVLLADLQQNLKGVIFSPNPSEAAIFLSSAHQESKVLMQQRLQELTALSPLLKNIYNSHNLINLAYINTNQSAVAFFPWLDVVSIFPTSVDIKRLDHYKLADKAYNPQHKAIWTNTYSDPSSESKILTLSNPVVSKDEVVAVAGLDITIDALAQYLNEISVPWGGYSLLMNSAGELLVFPYQAEADWQGIVSRKLQDNTGFFEANLLKQPALQPYLEPLHLDASGLVNLKVNDKSLLLSWSSVPSTEWKLLNVAPLDKVFVVKNNLTADYRFMLILGGSFLTLMFFVLVFFVIRRDQNLNLFSEKLLLVKEEVKQPDLVKSVINHNFDFIDLIGGPIIICKFDDGNLITACNTAFEHFAGSTKNNLKGRNLLNILGLKSLVFDSQKNEIELRIGQQEVATSYWFSLHYSENHQGLLLLLDISESKNVQHKLRSDRQRARLAAKMKAEFFQVAVSDANKLLLELLQNARGFDANLTNYCQSKLIELQHLLDNMRDMSDTGEADQQELAEDTLVLFSLIDDCYVASKSLLADSNRRLLIEYGTNIPEYLVLDRRRLFRLMRHLLRQMIQLSAKGDIYLWIGWSELGRLQLKIHDQGGGLAESERLKRFQLTTPMSSSYEITSGALGLGQLLTCQLVSEMRGSLEVEALSAGGLQLQIELPARLGKNPELLTLGHVLVVDDGPVNAMLASSVLEKSGYLVDVASSGAEALVLGKQQDYNLVLMDIFMPDMDGIETTRRWRELANSNAAIPIIALTANAMEVERGYFLQQGMNDYLAKPYRPNELRELVQCWLQEK